MTQKKQMDSFDNLFIRACKRGLRKNSEYEWFDKLARRFYLYAPQDEVDLHSWIAHIGFEVAKKMGISAEELWSVIYDNSSRICVSLYSDQYKNKSFFEIEALVHANAMVKYFAIMRGDKLKEMGYRSPLCFRLPDDKKASEKEMDECTRRNFEARLEREKDEELVEN